MASKKKKRGARTAPRSSFRNQAKTKKKPASKPKPATKKTRPPATKKTQPPATKPKPAAKKTQPAKKRQPLKEPLLKEPLLKEPLLKEPLLKGSLSTPPAPRNQRASGAKRTNRAETRIALGEITVPSGKLAIFDVGLVGYLPLDALEPAIIKADVPTDRPLRVVGVPVGKGRFSDCWDHVSILLGDGEPHTSKKLGSAGVDFARLILIDHAAIAHWQHEDSLDGKADFVFWGRDEAKVSRALNAPKLKEGYGWVDLTISDAEAKGDHAARLKSENDWAFATDHRPHTHHYYALEAARASKHGAGRLELANTQLMLLFTSWGDGVFPIYLERDADDHPVAVRIQLATEASNAAMRAVSG